MNISAKRLEEVKNIPDEDIDTSDIPELDAHFWENAKLVQPIIKQAISLRMIVMFCNGLKIKVKAISL